MANVASIRAVVRATATITVVADRQPDYARICRALADRPDLAVQTAASVRELLSGSTVGDVLVIHCDLVGAGELALCAQLRRQTPELLIVVVSHSENGRSARRAVDGGIDGLVFADQLEAALEPTIAAVLAGQVAVPRALRASVRKPALSFREKQVLGMVVMGFSNAEIGSRLFLAESTVKSHLSSAFEKLGVRSRTEAAAMILDPQGSLGTGILAVTSGAQVQATASRS
jgi:DNA-binding NarL/FixJ family response regulator